MSECTEIDKPCIAILMAIYEPRLDWLREQLCSLNAQTYPNLRLYIRDDCSPTVAYEKIQSCVQDCISSFPYEISRNDKNLGSNDTFELLTQGAEGYYYAYCDQDDIWLPEKLTILQNTIEQTHALLACSDMYVIDAEGHQIAESITIERRNQVFHSGEGLAEIILIKNFVTGCAMLVQAEQAKAAIPFCPYMVHDHYIALCCAARGAIQSVSTPLICYRIHGENQTKRLAGVNDKESYRRIRIDLHVEKLLWLDENFPYSDNGLKQAINAYLEWMQARQKNWTEGKAQLKVLRYCRFSPQNSLFELMARHLPDALFSRLIEIIKQSTN